MVKVTCAKKNSFNLEKSTFNIFVSIILFKEIDSLCKLEPVCYILESVSDFPCVLQDRTFLRMSYHLKGDVMVD